jgi:hypothetical protein
MMADTDELKARSIELAERAFRLRDRATDEDTRKKLHATGNELIMTDNAHRFYDAQGILEVGDVWVEDQRVLAHEMSVVDRMMRRATSISFDSALDAVNEWVEGSLDQQSEKDADNLTVRLAESLRTLLVSNDEHRRKDAIAFVLSYVEDVLRYSHTQEPNPEYEMEDPLILKLRDIRDSLLVHRELLYDEDELVDGFKNEGDKVERLGLARHQLDELYKAAAQ